jgi:hypothetical protein
MRRHAPSFDVNELMTAVVLVALVLATWRSLGAPLAAGLGVWLGLAFHRVHRLRGRRDRPASRVGTWLDSLYAAGVLAGLSALCGGLATFAAEVVVIGFIEVALGGLAVPSNRRLIPVYVVLVGCSGLLAALWAARRLWPGLWPGRAPIDEGSWDTL